MNIQEWAIKHHVSVEALTELQKLFLPEVITEPSNIQHEADVVNSVRIQASNSGWRLWKNTRGAGHMDNGNYIRFGLANESPQMNRKIKSGDLIGIRPIKITQMMVGLTIGQFVSREVKRPGWAYSGTPHELAQQHWNILINSLGGDAKFTTGVL